MTSSTNQKYKYIALLSEINQATTSVNLYGKFHEVWTRFWDMQAEQQTTDRFITPSDHGQSKENESKPHNLKPKMTKTFS